ncbi:MAG: dihydropteroate synthase [Phycisphaerae bacterium]|nr:dihydropteroate synthase [Phycisphaerae bacterium]
MKQYQIQCKRQELTLGDKPVIMGILNATPDSFSDGGHFVDIDIAVAHGLQMVADGAKIIDVGGESTRPGSQAVSVTEQIKRVVPLIKGIANQCNVAISIDTTSCEVAKAALEAGASIVNDVSALLFDDKLADLIAEQGCPIILMHMQGKPENMQRQPEYENVVEEVKKFLVERIAFCLSSGIKKQQIIIDPGIGFGKTTEHNLLLIKHIDAFSELGVPVLIGHSRKRFIGDILGIENAADRTFGNAAVVGYCVSKECQILRVHDVKETREVVDMTAAINQA